MENKDIWIILAACLGSLLFLLTLTLGLFCWRRSKRKIRGFSLRAVTPLDDAEFESWRRPSQYTQRPEKYGIRPTLPAVVRSSRTPNMFEKELNLYDVARSPSPTSPRTSMKTPTSPIRKPERVRRKSSIVSVADRPPTPYSPTSTTGEFPQRGSYSSRRSGSTPHIHYPSMSEASAFNFELESSPRTKILDSRKSDERPLHLSYARYGESP
ncbi:hypothetical protein BU24DRAFT_102363 [Aaosphaeria arxii CBS 175.79]|uniref:Uncharacterized protein n=1 Tax=Aaosphaeria arxii CBS 175.79 TaxID=1450172 RepID=A0A6A5Y196_9PLEO|nr:uncharacterized protein BU24DRAFT_102363 [Aaosphaeria arxii CBS 175.79]KAF2018691.1 hypothetical protein BU24DRAFT_102363 [Aaosphaeria arxii CBS 175.79]